MSIILHVFQTLDIFSTLIYLSFFVGINKFLSVYSILYCTDYCVTTNNEFRRAAHTSAYDKNPEDHTPLNVVPDNVIPPHSDKYWAPHPQTGVFGPPAGQASTAGGDRTANGGEDSVLEQKAWFRPSGLEDLEKPHSL